MSVKWSDTVVGPELLVKDQGPGIDPKHIRASLSAFIV